MFFKALCFPFTSWSRGQHRLLNRPTTNLFLELVYNNIKLCVTGFYNKDRTSGKFVYFIIFIIIIMSLLV